MCILTTHKYISVHTYPFLSLYILLESLLTWNFPGSPVVKTPHFHCVRLGFNPWWETKTLPATGRAKKKKKNLWLQNEKGIRLSANLACSSFSINSFIFRLTCLVKLGEIYWTEVFISEISHMYFSMIVFLIFHTVRMQLYRFSRRDETVKCKTYREHWFRGLTFDSTKFVFSLQSFH